MRDVDLSVQLGRLRLKNPILVASGTFGYAREMAGVVELGRLGGIVPKTITREPRVGNPPPRTVETASGLLNSIGLDNDGLDQFLAVKLPYLRGLGSPVIVSIAGRSIDDFRGLASCLAEQDGVAALELNISCPNVSGGVDFGTDPGLCESVVAAVKGVCGDMPILAKLTPNTSQVVEIAKAAENGGADGIVAINTCLGMAVDWRRRKPRLGNVLGGLSGPAIKPIALRIVFQVSRAVSVPVIGVGGIGSLDDCMEFFVTGASAVQIGTANFYHPRVTMEILDGLPDAVAQLGATALRDIVGTIELPQR
ncbi:MAG: dihydroorotate dehydrogenase [Planctomycetota bacterium]|nr:MAG: dihydroorotate dehydrogenase [Planctomycetota bacterium]